MNWKSLCLLLLICVFSVPKSVLGQVFLVENIDSKAFPELRFQIRSSDDLVRNKAALQIRDNNIPVRVFKVAKSKEGGSTDEAQSGFYDVRYTVPDPTRLDGNATFEYRGQQITTAYYIRKETGTPAPEKPTTSPAAPAQPKPYGTTRPATPATPVAKEEEGIPWIAWFLGAVALLGLGAFLLTRKRSRALPDVGEQALPEPEPLPVVQPEPVVPAPPPAPIPADHQAYMPEPQAVAAWQNTSAETGRLQWQIDGRSFNHALNGSRQTLGRAPDNDIVIAHPTVSAKHAVVRREGNNWILEDLGSTNGTYAYGNRTGKITLQDRMPLYFGQVSATFTSA